MVLLSPMVGYLDIWTQTVVIVNPRSQMYKGLNLQATFLTMYSSYHVTLSLDCASIYIKDLLLAHVAVFIYVQATGLRCAWQCWQQKYLLACHKPSLSKLWKYCLTKVTDHRILLKYWCIVKINQWVLIKCCCRSYAICMIYHSSNNIPFSLTLLASYRIW